MRGHRLKRVLLQIYRTIIGDVQVIRDITHSTLERTIYLGFIDSKDQETRVFYHVKQVRYLKIYSRWWLWEQPRYAYDLSYIKFVGMLPMERGEVTYPELCSGLLRYTKRPHLLAMDCHIKQLLATYNT